jgi:hypothetical protein
VETIGYSHEQRPILFFTVTSPENHAGSKRFASAPGPPERRSRPDAAPMVLWINFGVHGAEPSGMDAAIPLLYHFAAGQRRGSRDMLDNAVCCSPRCSTRTVIRAA